MSEHKTNPGIIHPAPATEPASKTRGAQPTTPTPILFSWIPPCAATLPLPLATAIACP